MIGARVIMSGPRVSLSHDLEELFERCLDFMYVADSDGVFIRVNRAFRNVLGYESGALEGQSFHGFIHPGDLATAVAVFESALESGELDRFVCRYRTASGSFKSIEWSAHRGTDGLLFGVGRDITAQLDLARDRDQAAERLRAVLDALPDLLFEVDGDHRLVRLRIPPELEGAIDDVSEEALLADQVPPEVAERLGDAIDRAFTSGEPQRCELAIADRDGDPTLWDCRITTTAHGTALADARNVTRERVAEQRLRTNNQILGQFASVIAHDLRAPMRGIQQLSGWIAEDTDTVLSGESQRYFELLKSRIVRLEQQLLGLAAFVRAGVFEVPVEEVDLGALVADIADEIRTDPRTVESGREVTVRWTDLPTFETARVPLRHALVNLINNAWKHHDQRRCEIVVSARRDGQSWVVSVTDNGPGIPERYHERAFEIFSTLKPRDQVEGAGLGLAIVARIMRACHGDVTIDSPIEGDRGTRFALHWPARWPRSGKS